MFDSDKTLKFGSKKQPCDFLHVYCSRVVFEEGRVGQR